MTEVKPLTIGQAVDQLVAVLESLDERTRTTVLGIVCAHLGIRFEEAIPAKGASGNTTGKNESKSGDEDKADESKRKGHPSDVRALKEEKKPRSAIEMAAIVAFYLKEHAPSDEKQATIGKDDLEKYFKQANFRLPNRISQLLPDAKAAGYFDSAERGKYKLNAVGYNLVAHSLPPASRTS